MEKDRMLTGYKCKTTVMITQLHRCHTAVPSDLIISNNQLSRNQSNQPISLSLDGTWQQTMAEGLNKGKESTSVVDLTIDSDSNNSQDLFDQEENLSSHCNTGPESPFTPSKYIPRKQPKPEILSSEDSDCSYSVSSCNKQIAR
jgi:hypothetical protein